MKSSYFFIIKDQFFMFPETKQHNNSKLSLPFLSSPCAQSPANKQKLNEFIHTNHWNKPANNRKLKTTRNPKPKNGRIQTPNPSPPKAKPANHITKPKHSQRMITTGAETNPNPRNSSTETNNQRQNPCLGLRNLFTDTIQLFQSSKLVLRHCT